MWVWTCSVTTSQPWKNSRVNLCFQISSPLWYHLSVSPVLSAYENAEPTMKSGCPSQCLSCYGRGKVRTKGPSFPSTISLSSFFFLFVYHFFQVCTCLVLVTCILNIPILWYSYSSAGAFYETFDVLIDIRSLAGLGFGMIAKTPGKLKQGGLSAWRDT